MSRHLALVILLVAVLVAVPAAAQTDDGPIIDLIDGEDDGILAGIEGFLDGIIARFTDPAADRSASEAADDLRSEFNAHNDSLETWVNDRTTADTDANVLELTLDPEGDGDETVYLVADVNGSDYENATLTTSTDRSVDESCTLEDAAAANAADELDAFHNRFVTEDRDVTPRYRSRLKGQYAGDVSCSFPLRHDQ